MATAEVTSPGNGKEKRETTVINMSESLDTNN